MPHFHPRSCVGCMWLLLCCACAARRWLHASAVLLFHDMRVRCLAVTAIAYSFSAFSNARPLAGEMAALLNPSGPPPSVARLDLEEDVLALQARLLHTAAHVQQLLYQRAPPLPISGRMPAILLVHCCYDCPGGKWVAVLKLKDMWEALDGVLSGCGYIMRDIQYQQRQLQQQEALPDEVVRPLLKRNDELCNSYDAPSRQVVHHLSRLPGRLPSVRPQGSSGGSRCLAS